MRNPEEVADRVVGHVRGAIVHVYGRHRYDREIQGAMEAGERHLIDLLGGGDWT